MLDIRGNRLFDGDLAVGKCLMNTKDLDYCIIIGENAYTLKEKGINNIFGNRLFSIECNKGKNQLVKLEELTEEEEELRKQLLRQLAGVSKSGMTMCSAIMKAKEIMEDEGIDYE